MSKQLPLHGGGLSKRSFINIKDVCDATYKISKNGIIGESYNISTNQYISIKFLVTKFVIYLEKIQRKLSSILRTELEKINTIQNAFKKN